jgi:3-dehydroquinate synthase
MLHDKKMAAGTLPFILAHAIGDAYVDRSVDLADIAAFLDAEQA